MVIAPFTEEELRSMRGYDRRCDGMTDHQLDLDELYLTIRCMARSEEHTSELQSQR